MDSVHEHGCQHTIAKSPSPHTYSTTEERKQAINAISVGRSYQDVADLLGRSRRTIIRWWKLYKCSGPEAVLNLSKSPGRPPRLSDCQVNELVSRWKAGELATLNIAASFVRKRWGVTYSLSGMSDLLRRHCVIPSASRESSQSDSRRALPADVEKTLINLARKGRFSSIREAHRWLRGYSPSDGQISYWRLRHILNKHGITGRNLRDWHAAKSRSRRS